MRPSALYKSFSSSSSSSPLVGIEGHLEAGEREEKEKEGLSGRRDGHVQVRGVDRGSVTDAASSTTNRGRVARLCDVTRAADLPPRDVIASLRQA